MRRRLLALLLLGLLMTGFFWYENCTLQSDGLTVSDPALPEAFVGLRIVVLADLHGRQFGADNERLLAAVAAAEPDLIALDGDLIEETTELPVAESLALGLTALAPTFYVTGNHEWASGCARPLMTLLDNCGVHVLENTWQRLMRDGQSILLAGVNDPNGPYDQKTPEEVVAAMRGSGRRGLLDPDAVPPQRSTGDMEQPGGESGAVRSRTWRYHPVAPGGRSSGN